MKEEVRKSKLVVIFSSRESNVSYKKIRKECSEVYRYRDSDPIRLLLLAECIFPYQMEYIMAYQTADLL